MLLSKLESEQGGMFFLIDLKLCPLKHSMLAEENSASPALLVPLDTAALADPDRVHTRWLLSAGASREMNSELESSRSKGGRRQRLSREAMRGGRAALLRRTTMARGDTDPRPPGRELRPDPSAALLPAPLFPAAATPGPARRKDTRRAAAPHTFGAENSDGAGLAQRLRLASSRPA